MKISPREALVYGVVTLSSLFLTAYTVHMLVGGLVPADREYHYMGMACSGVAVVIGFMAWDVVRRRR
ncbi:MAG: hypothetical protein GJU77_03330 [Ferrovum sp.]|jgi:hypothetical protein|uniref:hypothetical protein n=1 Tax=Ferrovum sp. TaxID=2609467 RepID=UPI0013B67ED8|nr:hypothetical protein [Ferrovum sp.]MBW8072707.1 hypothetical protein [Ferrovum sp.]NDU90744.1 hypothetical protein [Ferrovum sp.]